MTAIRNGRPHGWVILDKPLGLGSTQAVGAIKRGLYAADLMGKGRRRDGGKTKVGHGGTLDPLATGVLPIALGEATKLSGRMLDASKVYNFTIALGTQTDTLDLEGKPVATSDVRPTLADIEAVLPRFTGAIGQAPPAYSAIKIDGERAYDRARKGEDVKMNTRGVTIHDLSIADDSALPEAITLTAHVSKGTYIRSLARDIALALNTVGHVTMLRRTKAGPFSLEHAISLDKWADAAKARDLDALILPFEAGLDDIPALSLDTPDAGAVRQGRVLTGVQAEDGLYCAKDGDVPVALMELSGGEARIVRGFNFDH